MACRDDFSPGSMMELDLSQSSIKEYGHELEDFILWQTSSRVRCSLEEIMAAMSSETRFY